MAESNDWKMRARANDLSSSETEEEKQKDANPLLKMMKQKTPPPQGRKKLDTADALALLGIKA